MLKYSHIILLIFFLYPVNSCFASEKIPKHEKIQHLLTIINELHQEAVKFNDSHREREEVKKMIERKLDDIDSPEQLGRLALIASAIYSPGNAKDVEFDEVFYQTYQLVILKLAEIPDKEHYQALLFLKCHLCLDGGESLFFESVLQKVKQQLKD